MLRGGGGGVAGGGVSRVSRGVEGWGVTHPRGRCYCGLPPSVSGCPGQPNADMTTHLSYLGRR